MSFSTIVGDVSTVIAVIFAIGIGLFFLLKIFKAIFGSGKKPGDK